MYEKKTHPSPQTGGMVTRAGPKTDVSMSLYPSSAMLCVGWKGGVFVCVRARACVFVYVRACMWVYVCSHARSARSACVHTVVCVCKRARVRGRDTQGKGAGRGKGRGRGEMGGGDGWSCADQPFVEIAISNSLHRLILSQDVEN